MMDKLVDESQCRVLGLDYVNLSAIALVGFTTLIDGCTCYTFQNYL